MSLELYQGLENLRTQTEAFYSVDFPTEDPAVKYRIFHYRLATYTDFMLPNALESRGIMYRLRDGEEPELVCRPPKKFFNLNENPLTIGLDLHPDNILRIMDKADGSIISTFIDHNGKLNVKSNASLNSEQAAAAREMLKADDTLRDFCETETRGRFTVTMEYCAPTNRIVLHYEKPHLKILHVRSLRTGEMYFRRDYRSQYSSLFVEEYNTDLNLETVSDWTEKEGVVFQLADSGQLVKLKTKWYLRLHAALGTIRTDKGLFLCALHELTDDFLQILGDTNPALIARINYFRDEVSHKYNHLVQGTESWYNQHKELSRKDYAIKGQKELGAGQFHLAMALYSGKIPNYKEFVEKNYEEYKIETPVLDGDLPSD